MSANLSSGKASALLTRVQLNPEISTNDSAYVTDLVDRAAEDVVAFCKLPRYPELSQGYSKSQVGASEDISGISTNTLFVAVNGSGLQKITITLGSLNSGAAIATELQTQIQANGSDGFDEVTVTFAGTGATAQYTITSGRYGEYSSIGVSFVEAEKHVAQNLLLSPEYGGTEVCGSAARDEADDLVVEMVEILYRKLGIEGAKSGSLAGGNSFTMYASELSPAAVRKLYSMRRLW